jgi:hypothetical protein
MLRRRALAGRSAGLDRQLSTSVGATDLARRR